MRAQSELSRVGAKADGTVEVGRTLPGRGAWLCAGSLECFDLAARRGAFTKALRMEVRPGDIEQLRAGFVRSDPAARD